MLLRCALVLGLIGSCMAQLGSLPLVPEPTTVSLFPEEPQTPPTSLPTWSTMDHTVPMPELRPATYWITYSKTVRPGHPMVFQVQLFKGTMPLELTFSIKNNNGEVLLSHKDSISVGEPTTVELNIPLDMRKPSDDDDQWSWGWQQYTVEVMGRNQENSIKETGRASYQKKAFSLVVQTDKAMYKPSQMVRFRTLAMTPDMKVMRDVKQDIVVFDPKGNRILQFRGVQAPDNLGVFEKSFQLASSVPTGNWIIKVTVEGVEEEKEFEVADYVLPRFEVEVDGPDFGLNTDILYSFTVKAKYTFGKPVTDGTVNVEITTEYNQEGRSLKKRGSLDQNGEMKVEVFLDELKYIGQSRYYQTKTIPEWWQYEITANVTEMRTGKTHSGQHSLHFYPTPIKMEFLGITPDSFKSGLDFTAYLEVRKQDGSLFSPLELKDIGVLINVTYSTPISESSTPTTSTPLETEFNVAKPGRPIIAGDEMYPGGGGGHQQTERRSVALDRYRYIVPETGWVVVTFRVPDDATDLEIMARSDSNHKEVTNSKWVQKSYSPTDSFLQLSVINKKPRVGDTVTVTAKSTDMVTLLNYQVFSKGLLLVSKTKQGPSKSLEFSFTAEKFMSPSMSVVAFYVREDGEFVVDALSLSVDGLFDNAVSVEFSEQKVQPGQPVDLIVRGEQDSLVFLLAVDKSVKLLKSGNDITQDMVMEELSSYDHGNYGYWRYMFICGWPSYFGGQDASSVFENAGVIVMTDGLVYSRYNDGDYYPNVNGAGGGEITDDGGMETSGPTAGKLPSPSAGLLSAERTRKYFPENWLWKIELIEPVYFTMMRGAPVANAVADPAPEGGAAFKPATRVRKLFPENWLWSAKFINSSGEVVIPMTSPDTITTWLASAFSVNPRTGLSVAENPAEVITFRNMFVSLDLPSFIVRGEDFCFKASVFSYYPSEIPILLTLERGDGFSNILLKQENKTVHIERDQLYHSHFMGFLSENDVKTVSYCITPDVIGFVTIKVSALTDVQGLSDAVERKLQVKPEGVPRSTTVSNLVTLDNGYWAQNIPVQLPADTVAGSERIAVNIAGNLLGPVFDNLEDLLQKPYGCGEQNMINFSPIMSLVDFFYTTNTITEEFREKAVSYMLIGYMKEILYEHGETGSYSTFGNSENTKEGGSMWLTAFVTKCFSQAEILDMKYQNILAMDVNLIYRSAQWMTSKGNQRGTGEFVENGRVFNKGLQGGSSAKGIALTAYTVVALHNALKVLKSHPEMKSDKIGNGLGRAVQYLENNLSTLTDPYDVCITTYALTLVGSNYKTTALGLMETMAKEGFGMVNWERPKEENRETYYWSRGSDAINIEMTSYALLTYSLLGVGTTDGLPIIRWLSKQKGPNGGFVSTQDTVIGIEALTSVAKDLYGAEFVPMTITVNTRDNTKLLDTHVFQVNKDNEMLLQRNVIPYQRGSEVEVTAEAPTIGDTSKSTVLVDVVFKYNVDLETRVPTNRETFSYDMSHTIKLYDEFFDLWIKIWTTNGEAASMTMLEVDIPAGFDEDEEEILKHNADAISSIDRKEDRLNVYINTGAIDGEGLKLKLSMVHTGGILVNPKPKTYKVYDYYEPEIELSRKYSIADGRDFCTKVPDYSICPYQ